MSWRVPKFLAFVLLVLFTHASAADALPLVWCVAPHGHNAIEPSAVSHSLPVISGVRTSGAKNTLLFRLVAGGHGKCADFILSQPTQSPTKLALAAPPPDGPVGQPSKIEEQASMVLMPALFAPSELIADQLAQLRTVVLLI